MCLYGHPNAQWELIVSPGEAVCGLDCPEPVVIDLDRDLMPEKRWLSLIAIRSCAWLFDVAKYFAARSGLDYADR